MMIPPDNLQQIVSCKGRVVVGLSGGIDSVVLLHQMTRIDSIKLMAVHINHQLQPESESWAQFCWELCESWGVPLVCESVEIQAEGNLESLARQARYDVFKTHLKENDLLLLAHHQDDQIETIFLSLLRGDSPLGLKGMPLVRKVGLAKLLRPLLDQRQVSIENYAKSNGLTWVEDKSNLDESFDRNFLRQRIIPQLEARWPDMGKHMLAALHRTKNKLKYLDAVASDQLSYCLRQPLVLSLDKFRALNEAQQLAVLRCWIGQYVVEIPTHKSIQSARDAFLHAEQSSAPLLTWRKINIRRHGSELLLYPTLGPVPRGFVLAATAKMKTGTGLIESRLVSGEGINADKCQQLDVRFRTGGEFMASAGGHSQSLKNLFQAFHIAAFFRGHIPLLYKGDQLVGIAAMPEFNSPMVIAPAWRTEAAGIQVDWRLGLQQEVVDGFN